MVELKQSDEGEKKKKDKKNWGREKNAGKKTSVGTRIIFNKDRARV